MIVIAIAISLIIIILSKNMYARILNPITLLLIPLFLCFLLWGGANFISHDISFNTWSSIVLSVFMYIFGALVSRVIIVNSNKNVEKYSIEINDLPIIKFLFILSGIGFLIFVFQMARQFGILNILKNPNILNLAYANDELEINTLSFYLIKLSIVNSMQLLLLILKNHKSKSVLFMYAISLVMNISVRRSTFINVLILNCLTFILYQYRNKKIELNINKIKHYFYTGAALTFGLYFFNMMQEKLNKVYTLESPKMFNISISDSIATAIMYVAANIKSFDIYIQQVNNQDFPLLGATFRYFYLILSKFGFFNGDQTYLELDFVNTPKSFNTTLMQYYILGEGGYIWLIIFYFILGFLIHRLWKRALDVSVENDILLMLLSMISLLMVLSIREYMVISLDFIVPIVILTFMYIFKRRKKYE